MAQPFLYLHRVNQICRLTLLASTAIFAVFVCHTPCVKHKGELRGAATQATIVGFYS